MSLRRFTRKNNFKRLGASLRAEFIRPKPKMENYDYIQEHEVPCEFNLGTDHSIIQPPEFITEALTWANTNNLNQYTRALGYVPLCEEIAEIYGKKLGKEINPLEEVLASLGSTGSFNTVIWSILKQGEEVVTFEPFHYPWMAAMRQRGLNVKTVPLSEKFDLEKFENSISEKTKMIVIDNPSLANGRLLQKEELEQIAQVVRKNKNLFVISNESLHLQTKNYQDHISFASLPGVYDQTFTIFSGGLEFDCRGHRVGWIIAPAAYIPDLGTFQAYSFFSCQTPAMVIFSLKIFKAFNV